MTSKINPSPSRNHARSSSSSLSNHCKNRWAGTPRMRARFFGSSFLAFSLSMSFILRITVGVRYCIAAARLVIWLGDGNFGGVKSDCADDRPVSEKPRSMAVRDPSVPTPNDGVAECFRSCLRSSAYSISSTPSTPVGGGFLLYQKHARQLFQEMNDVCEFY